MENVLDLVLTDNETIIQNLAVASGISDHDMVSFDINLQLKNEKVT